MQIFYSGPPEAVRNLSIKAIASDQAVLAWRSGLTGGFIQKFNLVLKNKSEEYILDTHYSTSSVDELFTFKLTNLNPETPYSITIVSKNEYNGYSETRSKEITVSTRSEFMLNLVDFIVDFTVPSRIRLVIILTLSFNATFVSVASYFVSLCRRVK